MTDLVFVNGRVWTGSRDDAPVSALAVDSGRISALGDEALELARGAAEVVDLDGGMLLPGFADGHAHPINGGEELVGVPVGRARTLEELLDIVRQYADAHPELEWLVGGAYMPSLSSGGDFDARWLDTAVGDRPVVLFSADHHAWWLNSEALRRAGIDSSTPDPSGGMIMRRSDGSPLGIVTDRAQSLVKQAMPPKTVEDYSRELIAGVRELARAGVTWVQGAGADPSELPGYVRAAESGELTARVGIALWIQPDRWRDDLESFTALRRDFPHSPWMTLNTAKFMGDGALTSATRPTAAMIEPYDIGGCWHGVAVWEPGELAAAAAAYDAAGYSLHIHGVGDAAVRAALDAVEYVEQTNGPRDRRPVIAHVIVAQKSDVARFERLGVIPNMTPVTAQANDWTVKVIAPPLGAERTELMYPIGDLAASSVPLSFGSDWPVATEKPLEGISTAITRQTPEGYPEGGWIPSQRISLDQAIRAHTYGPAYQAGRERDAGLLRVGMVADLCQLGQDLYTVAPLELPQVPVLGTWVDGIRQKVD